MEGDDSASLSHCTEGLIQLYKNVTINKICEVKKKRNRDSSINKYLNR
jgi:hypothetical protein